MADKDTNVPNKNDFISREAAYKTLTEYYHHSSGVQHTVLREALNRVPTADVRPVVHGEWKNAHPSSPMLDGGGPPYCSVCGKEAPLRSVEVNQWKLERGSLSGPEVVYKTKCFLSNFCPNCGADMREPNLDATKGDNH